MTSCVKECDNTLVAALAYALRAKMSLVEGARPLSVAEMDIVAFIYDIKSGTKRELWPQILYATLRGLTLREADMSVAGAIARTLWTLDPDSKMPQDDIRDLCLGGYHDELRSLLEKRSLKNSIGL